MLPIVAVCLMVASSSLAAPVTESPASCIKRAEVALSSVKVPERLAKLVDGLREMNPLLSELSLVEFANNREIAGLEVFEVGLAKREERDSIIDQCVDLVKVVVPSEGQTCEIEFANSYQDFLKEVAKHSDYDQKLGTVKICLKI